MQLVSLFGGDKLCPLRVLKWLLSVTATLCTFYKTSQCSKLIKVKEKYYKEGATQTTGLI